MLKVTHREDGKIDVEDPKTQMSYIGMSEESYNIVFVKAKKESIPITDMNLPVLQNIQNGDE